MSHGSINNNKTGSTRKESIQQYFTKETHLAANSRTKHHSIKLYFEMHIGKLIQNSPMAARFRYSNILECHQNTNAVEILE